jgi:serine/threonine protein kinase
MTGGQKELIAVKTLRSSDLHGNIFDKELEYFRGEVYILDILKNTSMVPCIKDYWQDGLGYHIAMELVSGGNLKNILKKKKFFSETQCKFIVAQLVLFMEDLRCHTIIYR